MNIIFSISVIAFVLISSVAGKPVDEESAKEMECIKDLPNPDLDFKWFSAVKKWYFPSWSKLEAYRIYADLLDKDVKDLTEEEIENSCVQMNNNFKFTAFNKTREDQLDVKFDDESHLNTHFSGERDHGTKGAFHIAMTDNKSFIVGITCWEDNQTSMTIASADSTTLEPEVEKMAMEFVKSLGFKEELTARNKYDDCNLV